VGGVLAATQAGGRPDGGVRQRRQLRESPVHARKDEQMNDQSGGSRDPQRRSGFRRGGVLAAVLSSLVLLAACGGPAAPSATHAEWEKGKLLAFSACIRAHGVPDFPDPQPAGGFSRSALNPIDQNSPQFLAAEKACRSLAIATGFEHTPAELRKHVEQEIAESLCMRKHGVPNMPLPNAQGQMVFPAGGPNPGQPQFQAAQRHCAYLNP
jgi:hypothetical protein